jgi:hypothetical protein
MLAAWNRFWFDPACWGDLAMGRIAFYGLLFVTHAARDFSLFAEMGPESWRPILAFQILGVPRPTSAEWIVAAQVAWKLSLVFSAAGLLTRPATLVAAVLGFYLLGLPHNYGQIYHYDCVVVWMLAAMAVANCGTVLSLDAWLRGSPIPPAQKSPEAGWPIRFARALLVVMLFAAGFAKLRFSGAGWIASDYLSRLLYTYQYIGLPATPWGAWLAKYPLACSLLGGGALAVELAMPLALVYRRAGWILVPASAILFVGIWLLLGPNFIGLAAVYVFWVPWMPLLARWSAPRNEPASSSCIAITKKPLASAA